MPIAACKDLHMPSLPPGYTLHRARDVDTIPVRTFHDIARLRQEVFVVEQDCAYLDLDGRDLEPGTEQVWITYAPDAETNSPAAVAATLRVLDEAERAPGMRAIGRVVTHRDHRGKALARALMEAVVGDATGGPLVLEAQSHLTGWYEAFGFVVDGDEYLEDGIPHTPMRRG